MIVALAIVVAALCIAASARRLYFAVAPTVLHPDDVLELLARGGGTLASLRCAVEAEPAADWERDLFAALATPDASARAALVNEQLTELDLRLKRWERVPRVCASVATSFGIMLGTVVLREGLTSAPDLTGDLGELFVRSVLNDAISVAGFGIVGTVFCIAAHAQARRLMRARLEASDKMVERLESLADSGALS